MCKLYNQEKQIWKKMGLILDGKCTLESACQNTHGEADCSMAKECKQEIAELKAWLKGKHKKRGRN